MALTITAPAGGSRVGPGAAVSVHSSLAGPLQLDDLFVVQVHSPTTGTNYLVLGAESAKGLHDVTVTPGRNGTDIAFTLGLFDHSVAPGDAAVLNVYLAHHDLTVIDGPTTFTGYVWDSTSALYVLTAPQGTDISAIIAAIYRVFPAS